MNKKKMIALPLIAIMLSLTTAVALAHWVDNVYVVGTVDTGEFCACWTEADNLKKGIDWTIAVGMQTPAVPVCGNKDIAETYVKIVDCDTVQVNITNGYPCFYDHLIFGVTNCGTVPWAILSVTFETPYDREVLTANRYFTMDLDGDQVDDIEFSWGDNFGDQIDPQAFADLSMSFHLMNPIPQNATLTFSITLEVINWNEHPDFNPIQPPS